MPHSLSRGDLLLRILNPEIFLALRNLPGHQLHAHQRICRILWSCPQPWAYAGVVHLFNKCLWSTCHVPLCSQSWGFSSEQYKMDKNPCPHGPRLRSLKDLGKELSIWTPVFPGLGIQETSYKMSYCWIQPLTGKIMPTLIDLKTS